MFRKPLEVIATLLSFIFRTAESIAKPLKDAPFSLIKEQPGLNQPWINILPSFLSIEKKGFPQD
jgi:hypothetical protein